MSKSSKNFSKSNSISFGSILLLFLFSGAIVLIGLETLNRSYGGLAGVLRGYANTFAQSAYQWADLNVGERRVKSRLPMEVGKSTDLDSKTLFKIGGPDSGEKRARFKVESGDAGSSGWRSTISKLSRQSTAAGSSKRPPVAKDSIEKHGQEDRLGLSKLIENL